MLQEFFSYLFVSNAVHKCQGCGISVCPRKCACNHITERYEVSQGPRQGCEDMVCIDCNKHLQDKNFQAYKNCKKQCFIDKAQEISQCCDNMCGGMPSSGRSSCMEACNTPLDFGN